MYTSISDSAILCLCISPLIVLFSCRKFVCMLRICPNKTAAAKCFEVSVCHQEGEVGACPKNKCCHLCHNCQNRLFQNTEHLEVQFRNYTIDMLVRTKISCRFLLYNSLLFAKYTIFKSRFALRSPCCLVTFHSSRFLH